MAPHNVEKNEYGSLPERKITHNKYSRRGEKKNVSVVPSHFIQTDVSEIKGETLIFSDMMFYFVNLPAASSLESLHKLVAENGGTFSMNLNNSVTHCIAAESKGIKYQAAKRHGDIIHYSWVLDCCAQKKLLPLLPKYFLFTSDSSKKKLQEEMDEFSDSYYWSIDLADLKQLLSNIGTSANDNTVDHFKKKYCPKNKWSYFHGCSVYFYFSTQSLTPDQESLLGIKLRRLKLEVSMGGGKISSELSRATHLVVLTLQGSEVDIHSLKKSVALGGELLHNRRLHVVRSQWLDDSLEREQKLHEDVYSLKPSGWEDSNTTETRYDLERDGTRNEGLSSFHDIDVVKKEVTPAPVDSRTLASPVKDVERKRTRLGSGTLTKGKANASQVQRKRARIVKKHAKICEDEDEAYERDSFTTTDKAGVETREANEDEIHKSGGSENIEILQSEMMEEDADSSHGGGRVGLDEDNRNEQPSEKASDVEMGERHDKQEESFYKQLREKPEKVDVMVDPVQAILKDMVPSLGTTKLETKVSEAQKPSSEDNVAEPAKKKKVSYKNLAAQLLKD